MCQSCARVIEMKELQRRIWHLEILGYLLELAPFIQAVILTGSMTTGEAKEASDIDLLIVTTPKRLYTARFFATFWATATGLRRTAKTQNPSGKFCLNYYLTADNLDIRPHTARCAKFHRHIIRIWDRDGIHERIYRQNQWLRNFSVKIARVGDIEQLNSIFPVDRMLVLSLLRRPAEFLLSGRLGDFFEKKIGRYQRAKIVNSHLYKKNKKTIIASENELRLHPKKAS